MKNDFMTKPITMEKETEKQKLIQELNQLSENFEKNKQRMTEIAKILLAEHFNYSRKDKWEDNA